MWIASAEEIRAMDRRAIEEAGIPAIELMERAGAAAFHNLRVRLHEGETIAVVCGKGNNGGDGLVVARLAVEAGIDTLCLVAADVTSLSPESADRLEALNSVGGQRLFVTDKAWDSTLDSLRSRTWIVDGLLGIGANRDVSGAIADAIHAINGSGRPVLSLDVPSGLQCDTGQILGDAVRATCTVTFGLAKPFLFQNDGLTHSGEWEVADIGYQVATRCRWTDHEDVRAVLPRRSIDSNKGRNGHVLIVAGSERMRGAATLAATAALRAGAGLVTVASCEAVCAAVAAQLPEALLMPINFDDAGALAVISEQDRFDAGLFGPGMSTSKATQRFFANVSRRWGRPAVVDADALNMISMGVSLPSGPCVLTPHPGEAARLMGVTVAEIQTDRFASAREIAAKFGNVMLLKGAYSIVADAKGRLNVNSTGNPGLATGGSGDTLSGIIATLLAQGLTPMDAATCGMYWHGLAADHCAATMGSVGYMPTDVAEALPSTRDTMLLA